MYSYLDFRTSLQLLLEILCGGAPILEACAVSTFCVFQGVFKLLGRFSDVIALLTCTPTSVLPCSFSWDPSSGAAFPPLTRRGGRAAPGGARGEYLPAEPRDTRRAVRGELGLGTARTVV